MRKAVAVVAAGVFVALGSTHVSPASAAPRVESVQYVWAVWTSPGTSPHGDPNHPDETITVSATRTLENGVERETWIYADRCEAVNLAAGTPCEHESRYWGNGSLEEFTMDSIVGTARVAKQLGDCTIDVTWTGGDSYTTTPTVLPLSGGGAYANVGRHYVVVNPSSSAYPATAHSSDVQTTASGAACGWESMEGPSSGAGFYELRYVRTD